MASNLTDERNELREDDEKLQTALYEFDNEWGDGDEFYSEEEDEEDQLLIDLDDQELECEVDEDDSEKTAISRTPSFAGSISRSQSLTAADEESGEAVPRPKLELPSQINVSEHRPDPETTLHLNRILQGILEKHIVDIKEALEENKEKQEKLQEDASDYSIKPVKKGVYSGSFRAPYFRHGNSYPQPNEDIVYKKTSGDFDIISADLNKDARHFKKGAKELLREAVLEDYLEQMLKPIVTKMELEIQKRDKCTEEFNDVSCNLEIETKHLEEVQKGPQDNNIQQMIKELKKTIKELKKTLEDKRKMMNEHKREVDKLEKEIQSKRNIPEDEVLKTLDTEKVDWMKIAKQNFGGHRSWLDCQKAWENLVSPAISKNTWTKEDNKKLVGLVKSTSQDWKEIANAMNNGHTPFQCFSHYQQHLNSDLKPRPWTAEEDARLIKVTNNVKDYIGFYSWSKVSTMMDSRSPIECMHRFTKVDPLQNRGRWSELEDAKLLAAVEMIGPCWSKVAKFINTRNMMQCRDRYLNCLAPNINFSHFTYDEDVKLLKLCKNYGGAWAKMVPEFIGRTDNMLLSRYRQLQKWKQKNEWFERQTDETKKMLLGKSLTVAERRMYQAEAFGYLKTQYGIGADDYKRQDLDKQNGVDPDIIPPRPPRHLRCFGGSDKGGSLKKWSMKLNIHKRLNENLHRLLKKEAMASNAKKSKASSTLPEEVTGQIIEKTVEQTLKENNQVKTAPVSKVQIKRLKAALNKVFLTEGTLSVQELIRTSLTDKKRARKLEVNSVIESDLKDLLRRRGRTSSKSGRARRFFERDTRPAKVFEEEMDELDHSVPLLLMKGFGTNIHCLISAVQFQHLQAQEELLNLPSCEDDVDFKTEEAETQLAVQKLSMRTDITDVYRQQRLNVLKRRLKSLRRIFRERACSNSSIIKNKIKDFLSDLDYLKSLADESKEMEVNLNYLLMTCGPSDGNLDTEFEPEIIETTSPSSLSKSSTSITLSNSSSQLATINSSSADRPITHGDKLSDSSEFAVPLLPPKRKRTRFNTRLSSNSFSDNEPPNKRFKALSKQEIEGEKKKLTGVKKRVFTRLPYLPPNMSTLLGLRALLFKKLELIDKAGKLYKLEHHRCKPEHETGPDSVNKPGDIPVEDSASWFLYTNSQYFTEQASSFQSYKPHCRRPCNATHKDQTSAVIQESTLLSQSDEYKPLSIENEAFLIPLEERGGRLPNSGSRVGRDYDTDLKPLVTVQKELPVMASPDQTNSSYKIVLGLSGHQSAEYAFGKEIESNYLASLKRSNSDTIPVVKNSVSFFPDCLNKTNTMAPVSSVTKEILFISNDDDMDRNNTALNHRNASAQIETKSLLDIDSVSLHQVSQNGESIGDNSNDGDDTLADINFDGDFDDNGNSANTIIKICSGKSNSRSELNASSTNDGEIIILSEDGDNIFVTSKETNQPSDLGSFELPESRVQSILSNKDLKNRSSQIVLVDVDEDSKTIVHFKPEADKFKAYEALPISITESNYGQYISLTNSELPEKTRKEQGITDYMRAIRESDEYKLLLARFKSLFMWPALMSTFKPSQPDDGLLPRELRKDLLVDSQYGSNVQKKDRKRHRGRVKQSAVKRNQLRHIREVSLVARRNKTLKKLTNVSRENNESIDESAGNANAVNLKQKDEFKTAAETSGEASLVESDEVSQPKKMRGRPKGSKNRKFEKTLPKERPKRTVKKVREVTLHPLDTSVKEPVKSLPQWWKDAILAAMLAKKAMVEDGEEDCEVNLEDDNDFIDQGNYSDDEWYQQFRQQEAVAAVQPNTDLVCHSDLVALVSQKNTTEENDET